MFSGNFDIIVFAFKFPPLYQYLQRPISRELDVLVNQELKAGYIFIIETTFTSSVIDEKQ